MTGGYGNASLRINSTTSSTTLAQLGLAFNGGSITGTPIAAGTWTGTVKVVDDLGGIATTGSISLTVVDANPVLSGSLAAVADIGGSYSSGLTVTEGIAPYTWSIASGSLPAGLSINSTTGVVSGSPTTLGSSTFSVQVKDSNNLASTPVSQTITVNSALTISGTLAAANNTQSYSSGPTVSGGTAPYSFTFETTSGSDPVSNYQFTFNPTTGFFSSSDVGAFSAGTLWSGPITVTDSTGATASAVFTLTGVASSYIAYGSSGSCIVTNLSGSYDQFVGCPTTVSTSMTPTVSSGTASAYSIVSGSLPTGLSIASSTGIISGTPTVAGSYKATVQATVSSLTVQITLLFEVYTTTNVEVTPVVAVFGTVTTAYGAVGANIGGIGMQARAYGGNISTGYTWTASPALPTGVTVSSNGNVGNIGGTPTVAGTWTGTITASDTGGHSASTPSFTIVVNAAPTIGGTPPSGTVGTAYSWTPTVTGSVGGDLSAFSITTTSAVTLAQLGLSFNTHTGIVSGTPTTGGTWSGTVSVFSGVTVTSPTVSITIAANGTSPPAITGTPTTTANVGAAYSSSPFSYSGSGGTLPYTYTVASGALPAGLSINSSTGAITGTPTTACACTFTVHLVDANSVAGAATGTLTITVSNNPIVTGSPTTTGTSGNAYTSSTFSATGGTGSYTWSTTGNTVPGLTINSSGVLSGTIGTASGTYTFNVVATDTASNSGSLSVSITVQRSITLTSGTSFLVPQYNTMVVECIGGGGAGAIVSTTTANTYSSSAFGATATNFGSYCTANHGLTASGSAGAAAPTTSGMVGDVLTAGVAGSAGTTNFSTTISGTNRFFEYGGNGGTTSYVNGTTINPCGGGAAPFPIAANSYTGVNGGVGGCGGSGPTVYLSSNAGGNTGGGAGSSGAYARKSLTSATGPTVGSSVTYSVGVGAVISPIGGYQSGGSGGAGEIFITLN